MMFQNSPVPYLTRKLWKYSEGNRKSVVLYYIMFILANSIGFLEPLAVAYMLNIVQAQGVTSASMPFILLGLGFLLLIEVGFWAFHGPLE